MPWVVCAPQGNFPEAWSTAHVGESGFALAKPGSAGILGSRATGLSGSLKLTRFRGHRNICVQGVHDGEDETTLHS